MRKLFTKIKNFLFLYKANKDISIVNGNHYRFYENIFSIARKGVLSKWERDMAASLIWKLRKVSPYRIEGWAETQKIYEDYFKMDRHINSYEELKEKFAEGDVYVTRFRNEAPSKGKRFSEYGLSVQYSRNNEVNDVYKIEGFRSYGVKFEHNNDYASLDEDWLTAYLYSTPEEIERYEKEKAERERVEKLIALKQEEISNLYNQFS